jgi:hypothetical protein
MKHRAGWIMADAIFGLILLIGLGLTISSLVYHHRTGIAGLNATQDAIAAAERVMSQLQLGQPVDPAAEPATVIQVLERDKLLASHRWVRITVERQGKLAELVGLAPLEALPK